MRLLAGLWILQGLFEWSRFMLPREEIFDRIVDRPGGGA